MVDGPTILGRQRWEESEVTRRVQGVLGLTAIGDVQSELYSRVLLAAFAESALVVAESNDFKQARRQAERLLREILSAFSNPF